MNGAALLARAGGDRAIPPGAGKQRRSIHAFVYCTREEMEH
ncbi:MAG TPA: hypothetical protein VGM01_01240 [Ktedonobacteraceae bacterium]